jgi:hypothetical protein
VDGLKHSIRLKNRRTDAAAWAGWVGLLWMTGYWAPGVDVLQRRGVLDALKGSRSASGHASAGPQAGRQRGARYSVA